MASASDEIHVTPVAPCIHLIGNKRKKIKVQTSFCNDCTSEVRVWDLVFQKFYPVKNEGSMCMHVDHKLSWASLCEIWEEPDT